MSDIPERPLPDSRNSQLLPADQQRSATETDIVVPPEDKKDAAEAPKQKRVWGGLKQVSAGVAIAVVMAALIVVHWKSPGLGITERILLSSFVVFSSGFAVLLLVFVVMTILGRINLAQALEDKPATIKSAGISLSRLQAFLWTLVILTTYFYQAVSNRAEGLPTVPPDLLMVMGISSAVYLTSKNMSARKEAGK